ncbi:MAG: hypothetical protein AB7L66_10810 [Gemmatimonadales bacterium]
MTTQQPDRVRQYLRRRGCTPSVVKGGLDGLLSHWESLVAAVEDGYDLTFDDYLNDMDLRDILAGALEVAAADDRAAAERRIEKLDRRFHSLTVECGPIWGETAARENGHDSNDQWWYFRRPKRPAPDFEEELREAGLV